MPVQAQNPAKEILNIILLFCFAFEDDDYPWASRQEKEKASGLIQNFYANLSSADKGLLPKPQEPDFYQKLSQFVWGKIAASREEAEKLFGPNLPTPDQLAAWEEQKQVHLQKLKTLQAARQRPPSPIVRAHEEIKEEVRQQLLRANPQLEDSPEISVMAAEKITASLTERAPLLPREQNLSSQRKREAPGEALPADVLEKLAVEEEGTAFVPIMTLLSPKLTISFAKKAAFAPAVKILQAADAAAGNELQGNALLQMKQLLHKGVTADDFQNSITVLEEAGLPPQHPQLQRLRLQEKAARDYESTHPKTSWLLRNYHEYSKRTVRRQTSFDGGRTYLPRTGPKPTQVGKRDQPSRFRSFLNRVGVKIKTHQRVVLAPGKTVIRFVLPDKITRLLTFGRFRSFGALKSALYRKTLKPAFAYLGKTALGKGVKKASAWALSRLGLASIPTGVTQAIALGLLAKDALKISKNLLHYLSKRPLLVGLIGAGLLLLSFLFFPFLLPILLVLGGVILAAKLLSGAINLAGGLLSGAGGILGGIFSGIGGFFSSLSTLSVPSTMPLMGVGGAVGLTAAASFFITGIIVPASFLKEPASQVGAPVPYKACALTEDTPGSGVLKEMITNAAQWAGVPPAVLAGIASIEGNHLFGYSGNQVIQYSQPGAQDPVNCQPNGCGARGPMQFLNNGVAGDCGQYTGQTMPDVWASYKSAVNQALPAEPRTPEVCNIKDSLYAAAWKIKTDSGTSSEENCAWTREIIDKVGTAYYGPCTEKFPHLGNKTYCQYLWDYYQGHNAIGEPSPSGWFYWQGDPRWGSYGISPGCNLANHGCGPTSMAMVFTYFNLNKTPPPMWDRFVSGGYMICRQGSSWRAMAVVPQEAGLSSQDLGTNWSLAESKLAEGKMVIAATNLYGGHILVIRGIAGNNVLTNDPAVANGDGKTYTRGQLLLLRLWAIGK